MKRIVILGLMAIACLSMQAQEKNVVVLAKSNGHWDTPSSIVKDKKSKKTIAVWPRTEKDDWFEPSGLVLDNVPTVDNFDELFPGQRGPKVVDPFSDDVYVSLCWRLTEENDETVLHCYMEMPADIVENFWVTDEEGGILDLETGISYRARRIEPDCYYKRFAFKGKKGSVVDFKIFFPELPETTKRIAIYGVPNWGLRGKQVFINRSINGYPLVYGTERQYDNKPEFHHPTLVAEAKNYDKDNFFTWSEYKDVHLIKPVKGGTMAMWLTPEATYVAIATELNWHREYFGRGDGTFLIDNSGHQYKCKDVIDFPNGPLFWVQGVSGDYFAIVLVFDPLPLNLETITYISPEREPFNANFANWEGDVKPGLSIKELRNNQHLFEYFPRKMVE